MKKIIGLLVLVSWLAACSVIDEPEEITLVNIGTEYYIELGQSLQIGPNSLRIDISTFDTNNCESSYIDFTFEALPHLIRINLDDTVHPSPCIKTEEAIQSSIDLPLSQGVYEMNILLKGIVQNDGAVVVTKDKFKLKLETENGVIVLRQEINIIPDGYVWGRFKVLDANDLTEVKKAVQKIRDSNSKSELANGNYGYFEVNGHQVTLLTGAPASGITETFLLKSDQAFSALESLMVRFSELHPNVKIELYDSQGAFYLSE